MYGGAAYGAGYYAEGSNALEEQTPGHGTIADFARFIGRIFDRSDQGGQISDKTTFSGSIQDRSTG